MGALDHMTEVLMSDSFDDASKAVVEAQCECEHEVTVPGRIGDEGVEDAIRTKLCETCPNGGCGSIVLLRDE